MSKQTAIQITPLTEVEKAIKPELESTEQSAALVEKLQVGNDAEMEVAAQWIAEVMTSKKDIDAKRKVFTGPLMAVVKEINDFFRPALDALDTMEKTLKSRISEHITTNMASRDALLASVADQPTADQKASAIEMASTLVPKAITGVSIREAWDGELIDPTALVKWAVANNRMDLIQPNEKALKGITKAQKADPQIPGWVAGLKRSVVVTPSKIK